MLTLYFSPGAASLCVHHLLIELGVEHRVQRVDTSQGEQKSEAYLKLNPGGVVPTLLVDDVPMVESAAMLMWLAANDTQRRFAPAAGSAEERLYLSWFLLLANGLQPAFRHWFYPQEAAGEAAQASAKECARERIEKLFQRIDTQLASTAAYLCGAQPLAVDFFLFMLMRWSRNMPRPATSWPACAAFVARMKARPSFTELYAREGLTEWA
ncbi:MAG: glutathione S-transferase family protein [Lysobacteraceae bacterium]